MNAETIAKNIQTNSRWTERALIALTSGKAPRGISRSDRLVLGWAAKLLKTKKIDHLPKDVLIEAQNRLPRYSNQLVEMIVEKQQLKLFEE